ncbi:MAG: MFS transporter, partial [Betaproteobacteria bacterium]|nr:MFS transporter [Betaproteobacteria bacterium]
MSRWHSPMVVLVCGSVLLSITLGIRHTFGLFLQPMSMDHGWGREVFGLGAALMNLLWGLSQPFTGMLADRFGAVRVLFIGGILYTAGVLCMATATTPLVFVLGVGVLVGLGMSAATFSTVFGAFGRNFPPEKHSMVLGIGSAAGSVGQFALLPLALAIITWQGWFTGLLVLAALAALVAPLSLGVHDQGYGSQPQASGLTLTEALREAFAQRGFWLLTLGYFTCGFQIVFIGTHFPAFLLDRGLTAADGTVALALIGLFNILGSWGAGWLGSRFPRTYLLAAIYASRGLAIIALLAFPLTSWSAYAFGAVLGFGWLATVPLTTGVVAGMFGVKHLAMLSGLVFLSHQVGGFFGGWLGGYLFDATGSYQVVWMIAIAL